MTPRSPRPGLEELAAAELDAADEQVLRHLARMYDALDPVPRGLVERIQFGITLEGLHAEIAQLQRGAADLAGVRSDDVTEVQTITFTSSSLTTMVTITPTSADRVRIDGWLAPGGGSSVELRLSGDRRSTVADEDGRFVFEDVARGFAQFVLRPSGGGTGPAVITPSVDL
jgi:hypothetical protein